MCSIPARMLVSNLIEPWIVATRPAEQNGLGMTPDAVSGELTRIKSMFEFLPDSAAVYPIWEGGEYKNCPGRLRRRDSLKAVATILRRPPGILI